MKNTSTNPNEQKKPIDWTSFNVQVAIGYSLLLIVFLLFWIAFVK